MKMGISSQIIKTYQFGTKTELDAFVLGMQTANENPPISGVETDWESGVQYEHGLFDDRVWIAKVTYEDSEA
jgi:hypothetical protein